MSRRFIVCSSLLSLLALSGYACSSGQGGEGGTANTGGASSSGSSSGGAAGADASDDGLFTDHGAVVSIVIDPPTATVDIINGSISPVNFTAIATFQDGATSAVAADWSIDRPTLGLVSPTGGVFTASGALGGKGIITADYSGLKATADVSVTLHVTQNPAGLSPADQGLFDTPDAAPSGTMLYPYDKTVFARGLLAPELMWSGGAAGDTYLVHIEEAYMDLKVYTTADPPSAFVMSQELWSQLTESNGGEDVKVDVQRLSGGKAFTSMHETWTIAQGSLRGSIYYWAVNTGQLMKIAPGAASAQVVFDSGPYDQLGSPAPANYDGYMPPWSQGVNNKRCVACHTVSKDGSTIAAVFERKSAAPSPWGTIDLTASPPGVAYVSPYDSQTLFVGLAPDGAYAVPNSVDFKLRLVNAKTGASIPSALDAFADKVADPAFSPDGKLLAFSSNVTGSYPVEFSRADLDVIDFDPQTQAFSNRRLIAEGQSQAIAFPNFSPDSSWVFYQKGNYSRAKYGNNQFGSDDLYVTDVAKQVGEIPLQAANGAFLDAKNQHLNYQPTVNPISVAGYSWVVFVSPRDYGNKMASTNNPTYQNRKQLWVAAVDANPQPGKDPSHPAFWLPGQDLATINMSGYWALEPCKQTGSGCDQGFECCTGFCQPDGNGGLACVPPPGTCSNIGEKCTASGDCCGNPQVKCVGGFCAQGQPN